jgi:putative transposase
MRWCSGVLEFTCWNGDLSVLFALDGHDREVVSWVATTAGISGEMVMDMMVQCVEQRFGDLRAPQWLTDNGSVFAANRTLEIAAALNLEPCFTPAESPESSGMAEAFVKTFKRHYIRINPLPDARTALTRIDHWTEITTPNTRIPGRAIAHRESTVHRADFRRSVHHVGDVGGDLVGTLRACCALREICCVADPCSSTADAIADETPLISLIATTVSCVAALPNG